MKFLIICVAVALFAVAASKSVVPLNLNADYNMVQDGSGNWFVVNENDVDLELETFFVPSTDVFFRLFTRSNPTTYQTIVMNDLGDSLAASNFDASKPTIFISHGWNNEGTSEMPVTTKAAFLNKIPCNVFIVDWGLGSNDWNVYTVIGRVPGTGEQVGKMIRFLGTYKSVSPANIHMVGHSLGAHIAGFAAKYVKSYDEGLVGSIVGLDTTNLGYDINNHNTRLHYDDAEYVQTLHTSALGFQDPIGHASFFANYGTSQPGCGWDWISTCAHGRSHLYHTESIGLTAGFIARKCIDISEITANTPHCTYAGPNGNFGGYPLDSTASGVYWLPVNSTAPWAKGAAGLL